jgi:anaerobic glycerol-3-phosphate dehydrogenase
VTGAQLAHFNPSVEISGEGVAIATAYRAAENALKFCGR